MTATIESGHSEQVFLFNVDHARSARRGGDGKAADGLEKMLEYLAKHESTATLTPLDGSDAQPIAAHSASIAKLSGQYLLRANSKQDSLAFEKMLGDDARVEGVYRPPSYRSTPADTTIAAATAVPGGGEAGDAPFTPEEQAKVAQANAVKQWGIDRCGFREAWRHLEHGENPGPIVMIDNGRHLGHRELQGVIDYNGPKRFGQASIADHASSVAAIMCARRGEKQEPGVEGMDGCCSAGIELFNVWTRHHGVDHAVLYNALKRAINLKRPVVNISMWLQTKDHHLEGLLQECAQNDVAVVAAIGNTGTSATEFYPATDPNVIAVAATDPADRRYTGSITGRQVFIAAPGENILTVVGDTDYDHLTGTSFSAPFVSAAVWLAKKRSGKQRLTNLQVRWLLAHSVEKPGQGRTKELGYGRLDMGQLVKQLPKVPSSDECVAFFGQTLPNPDRLALR